MKHFKSNLMISICVLLCIPFFAPQGVALSASLEALQTQALANTFSQGATAAMKKAEISHASTFGRFADSETTHIVARGDNLYDIANTYNVSVQSIVDANKQIENPSLIRTGWKLTIPTASMDTHTISKGDTFYALAGKYDIDLSAFMQANPGKKARNLQIGDTLIIPKSNSQAASSDASNPSSSSVDTSDLPTSSVDTATFAQQALDLINAERSAENLSTLSYNDIVAGLAQTKSDDMAKNNYLSHTSPSLGTPFDMLRSAGIDYRSAGENIARGHTTPEAVVQAWMQSPAHRANILNPNFNQIGVGVSVDSEGHLYWSQIFLASDARSK